MVMKTGRLKSHRVYGLQQSHSVEPPLVARVFCLSNDGRMGPEIVGKANEFLPEELHIREVDEGEAYDRVGGPLRLAAVNSAVRALHIKHVSMATPEVVIAALRPHSEAYGYLCHRGPGIHKLKSIELGLVVCSLEDPSGDKNPYLRGYRNYRQYTREQLDELSRNHVYASHMVRRAGKEARDLLEKGVPLFFPASHMKAVRDDRFPHGVRLDFGGSPLPAPALKQAGETSPIIHGDHYDYFGTSMNQTIDRILAEGGKSPPCDGDATINVNTLMRGAEWMYARGDVVIMLSTDPARQLTDEERRLCNIHERLLMVLKE